MFDNIIWNGLSGSSMYRLLDADMNPAVLRPWKEINPTTGKWTGRNFITVNTNRVDAKGNPIYQHIVTNAPALLTRDEWLRIDQDVMAAARLRLQLWSDIYGRNPYTIPDGMGTISIMHQTMTDISPATISMDPIRKSERDRPTFDTAQIPLPVIHKDGGFTAREIAVSRKTGAPIDTATIQLASMRVAEEVEKLSLGVSGSFTYGAGTVYGLTNFPQRNTKTLTLPTAGGWTPATLVNEILAMIQQAEDDLMFGPYVLYYSTGWGQYMGRDYAATYGGETLYTRMGKISPKIQSIQPLDFLTNFQIVLVQMTPNVIQGVQGMGITTVQWEEQGGFEQCFKVLCIQIPRVRADAAGNCGIVHGVAA